jgi:hypothetical protein
MVVDGLGNDFSSWTNLALPVRVNAVTDRESGPGNGKPNNMCTVFLEDVERGVAIRRGYLEGSSRPP